jgi:23S rRNA pseudouridine1911/1915/1917 synthase
LKPLLPLDEIEDLESPGEDKPPEIGRQTLVVPPEAANQRLDRFLATTRPELSRVRWQALVARQYVKVNSQAVKASLTLTPGDSIEIAPPPALERSPLEPAEIPLEILFEDGDLLVINKAAGMVVHPGAGTDGTTLVHALLHHCRDLSGIGGVERPGIVHRLDRETSGCLVVAKNDQAHKCLAAQFANREVSKTYLAVVRGIPHRPWGSLKGAIGRHPYHRQKMAVKEGPDAREALTEYTVLARGEGMSLIECLPKTGRTHQIRVHLQHLGHPLLGDPVYGHRLGYPRHLLHAWKLSFTHPSTSERLSFTAPVPADFPLHPPDET